ncbi:MAG: hypothetical protein JNM63_17740 [Spirochaetia bacterium]|nr:hypothetical protein [Spirochaetia bacterium]
MEYPHATATLRACSLEVDGLNSRRFKICGTKGTVDLSPLERFDGKPLQMKLTLTEDRDEYSAGNHLVDFGLQEDRYQAQLLELARMIKDEMQNPYNQKHDTLVQEVLLAASGYTQWRK